MFIQTFHKRRQGNRDEGLSRQVLSVNYVVDITVVSRFCKSWGTNPSVNPPPFSYALGTGQGGVLWSHPMKLSQTAQRGADARVYRGVWELIGQLTGVRKLTLYCVCLIIRLRRHT